MPAPKNPKTRALIERMNIYLRDNPTCKLEDAAKILNVKSCTVRKWKQVGWITHTRPHIARQQQQQVIAAIQQPTPITQAPTARKTRNKTTNQSSGVVAPDIPQPAARTYEPDDNSMEALIARGRDLKISEIRALVKAHLVSQVRDAKAVSNFAAGLKALSGVQDVELEDIYETEQMIKIYVPAEDVVVADDVIEVEPIEY